MKCYDFELNISAYIEGELKQVVRQSFNEHKESCTICKEKLVDITQLMDKIPKLTPLVTSSKFINNLNAKIKEIDNKVPSMWERLIQLKPLGFEPAPAIGFVLAIFLVISSAYLLINRDGLPKINMDKLSTHTQKKAPDKFIPSVVSPLQTIPSIADSDSSTKLEIQNRYHDKIKLTGAGGN